MRKSYSRIEQHFLLYFKFYFAFHVEVLCQSFQKGFETFGISREFEILLQSYQIIRYVYAVAQC